jgi:chromosome partitioning protein
METSSICSVCERAFVAKFRYQVQESEGRFLAFCSQVCQARALDGGCACSVCGAGFTVEYPWQCVTRDETTLRFCSPGCRDASTRATPTERRARRIAVFNHKGGTGKTTTAINVAAAFAERGHCTLLVDCDGQGNVGASLGIRGERSLYHVLVHGEPLEEVAVPVRSNLDILTSNETLAAAELWLAARPNRDRVLRERLGTRADGYDLVVLDCAPALSLMNQNALVYADSVLVPVSCDFLSLVGVKQVLRTLKSVRDLLAHDCAILGVVPTFYDARNKACREAVDALREHFGDRCLAPIRTSTKLAEAPAARQTIFEHAPDSNGAHDYLALVDSITATATSIAEAAE